MTPRPTVPDLIPTPSERLGLAVAGPTVVLTDPNGRVARLARDTLRFDRSHPDPARPRSIAFVRGTLLVADDESLMALDPVTLAPRAATRSAGASLLAHGGGVVALSLVRGEAAGRVCLVDPGLSLDRCAGLSFAPTGLGVAPSGRLFVADGASGGVMPYRSTGRALVSAGAPIPVGRKPHGRLVSHRGLLYVPVERGIAIVDPDSRTVTRTVTLPVTPSDIWLARATGRLFAALPGVDRVALLDTGGPAARPRLVAAAGEPVAVAGGSTPTAPVVVLGADGTVTRLDARTGARLGARHVSLLGAPSPARLLLGRVVAARDADALEIVFRFTGGRLDEGSVVVRDGALADGDAAFEVWQGGIRTKVRTRTVDGIAVRIGSAAAHLRVALAATSGEYERLRISRDGPRTIAVSLRRVTAPSTRPAGGTSTRPATPTAPAEGGTATKPPPTGQYDVG